MARPRLAPSKGDGLNGRCRIAGAPHQTPRHLTGHSLKTAKTSPFLTNPIYDSRAHE